MDRWLVETSLGGSRILCLEALESCPRSSSGSNTNITRETCSTKCTLHQEVMALLALFVLELSVTSIVKGSSMIDVRVLRVWRSKGFRFPPISSLD